jgi:hypothetical protein
VEGSFAPEREVLLAFLNEEEHASWAKQRHLVVYGGTTGHEYLLAHRESKLAKQNTRICYDLDDKVVLHFHDRMVPPEEEVLAAKLILENRECWLRNEATLHASRFRAKHVLKNPFGDVSDGVPDAQLTSFIAGFGMTHQG